MKTETQELKAGRALDVEVAVSVMKWGRIMFDGVERWAENGIIHYAENGSRLRKISDWNPSTDIGDAWEVVEKLQTQGGVIALEHWGENWECYVAKATARDPMNDGETVFADTASLAICLAALKSVESQP